MRPRIQLTSVLSVVMLALMAGLVFAPACTFYGEHSARSFSDATGGEGLERVFWKSVAAAKWIEVERVLASNYVGVAQGRTLDRAVALEQYRHWKLKDYSLGDLTTEMNGSTIVVTYTITLTGTSSADPLPAGPQRMMTVWQQQKGGWVEIAHSVSQP